MNDISFWPRKPSRSVIATDLSKSEIPIQTREMVKMEEDKPLINKEEMKEKDENSLLNYEYDEDDDGVDWET